jgi:Dolichyl-phosphate-mannose-protein mannosyltransferase
MPLLEQAGSPAPASGPRDPERRARWSIRAVWLLALLVTLRYALAAGRGVVLFGDEYHSLFMDVDRSYASLATTFSRSGIGMLMPMLQKAAIALLGQNLWAFRLPAMLAALVAVAVFFPAGRRVVGAGPAAVGALALAANGLFIFYTGFARAYSLMMCMALVVLCALSWALESETPRAGRYLVVSVAAAVLAFVHYVAGGAALGLGIGALLYAAASGRWRRHGAFLVGALVLGAVLSGLLYLPSISKGLEFLRAYTLGFSGLSHDFTWFDVVALQAGSRPAAVVGIFGFAIGALLLLRRRTPEALFLLSPIAVSVVSALLVTFDGGTAEYARYTSMSLPFAFMLLAWTLFEGVRAVRVPGPARVPVGLGAGVVLVTAAWLAGPRGVRHVDDGPFAATYHSLQPLPAFDVPWPRTPELYRRLGRVDGPLAVIVTPPILDRGEALYRHYWLQYRKRLLLGVWHPTPEIAPGFRPELPYVMLDDPRSVAASGADYLVVHKHLPEEIEAYLGWVLDVVWPDMRDEAVASMMGRNTRAVLRPLEPLREMMDELRARYGDPVYEDPLVTAWKLRPGAPDLAE